MNIGQCMNDFSHALRAEWIKGRRTFLRRSPILFAIAAMLFLLPHLFGESNIVNSTFYKDKARSIFDIVFERWIFYLHPLYCYIVGIAVFHTEHRDGMWKHTNAKPVSGTTQLLAKHVFSWCHVAAATFLLAVLILTVLLAIKIKYPEIDLGIVTSYYDAYFDDPSNKFWRVAANTFLCSLVAGMALTSLNNLFSARFSGGFLMLFMALPMAVSALYIHFTDTMARYTPWMFGQVLLDDRVFNIAPPNNWLVAIPLIYAALCLAAHITLQRKKPLY